MGRVERSAKLAVVALIAALALGMGCVLDANQVDQGQQCSADRCGEDGVCCQFVDCVTQCEYDCLNQDAQCDGGANESACNACAQDCRDSCNVSQECRTALDELDACSQNNGCQDSAGGAGDEQCLEENCCAELEAAL